MEKISNHLYILSTIFFTVYSQLVMRWQVSMAGPLPESLSGKLNFIFILFTSPWVLSALCSTFLSGVSWMLAMTKFEISYAYPWVALNFVLMLIFGVLLFNESFDYYKLVGTLLIMAGIFMIANN